VPYFDPTRKLLWIGLLTLLTSAPLAARERSNPFAQPNHLVTSTNRENISNANPELKLKAVMPGEKGLANIGGKVMRIGDVYEGYELISVTQLGARLRRGEQILELELRPVLAQAQRNAQ
jgi:hypothetical protein